MILALSGRQTDSCVISWMESRPEGWQGGLAVRCCCSIPRKSLGVPPVKISVTGALVGAAIGALARGAVVVVNLGPNILPVFVVPSAAIGVFVGLIAGAMKSPWTGAIVGAVLSAVVFELFMLPCISLLGLFGSVNGDNQLQADFFLKSLVYALEMGLAGALAGGLGSLAGQRWGDSAENSNSGPPDETA